MHIGSTVHPGQRGTKRLLTQYGERLVCVRYRYDATRQKRFKTVELIVAEDAWTAPTAAPKKDELVHIALTVHEVALRQQVKQRGGRWNPQRGLWELRYEQVLALGLQARIIDAHGPASPKTIAASDVVQVHLAPIASGYTVDLCRTFLVEPVAEEATNALRAYIEAQERGIASAAPGAALMGIDAAMADSLEQAGFDGAFLRPVFHGVGIEHEEAPIPGGHAVIHGEQKVEEVAAGMVLGIGNCGIYREHFGVRVEDTVWVTEQGPVSLTHHPKVLNTTGV